MGSGDGLVGEILYEQYNGMKKIVVKVGAY